MTPKEFAHATMLVSSLRTRLGHANALAAAVKSERDDLAKQLAAHVESLKLSNAQCGEYLLQNEMLAADRATLYAELQTVIAERDKEYEAGALMQIKLAETTKDVADLRLAVDTMFSADKERLHSELVNVRAALASVTEQRDSLRRTLDEWDRADTKPHARVAADDIADHVVPPVLPMCTKCHYCLHDLEASVFGPYHVCPTVGCPRTVTNNDDGEDKSPYNGPCTSSHPVRHE